MNKFWLVTKHTFLTKVKSKQFLIATAVMILLTFGLSNMSKVAQYFDNNEGESIGVIASSEDFEKLKTTLKGNKEITELLNFQTEVESEQAIKNETIKGYVTIGIENDQYHATFKTLSISNENQINVLYGAVSAINAQYQMVKLNIPADTLAKINAPITFEKISLEKNAKSQEELNQARGLVYALLFVIYISVLMYSNMIASEVASEKTSRIMEILISSVPPIQQMFAKILGIALLSITQIGLLLTVGYSQLKRNISGAMGDFLGFEEIPLSTFIYAVIFVLLGYLLYATLAALLGSLVSRIEDVQQMVMPMTTLVIIGFMISMVGLGDPTTQFIKVTSFIPFFSPMIMFLRVGLVTVPFWQIALSIGILVGTIIFLGVFGAKVYKGGVLMYGKSSSFKDIRKALQLSKKE
jgi:ABC-2 type transport system permease protein